MAHHSMWYRQMSRRGLGAAGLRSSLGWAGMNGSVGASPCFAAPFALNPSASPLKTPEFFPLRSTKHVDPAFSTPSNSPHSAAIEHRDAGRDSPDARLQFDERFGDSAVHLVMKEGVGNV